jgi:hypothetical protein
MIELLDDSTWHSYVHDEEGGCDECGGQDRLLYLVDTTRSVDEVLCADCIAPEMLSPGNAISDHALHATVLPLDRATRGV